MRTSRKQVVSRQNMVKGALLLMVVLAVAAFSGLFELKQSSPKQPTGKASSQLDYYMSGFILTELNRQGKVRYRIQGARARRFDKADRTEVDNPKLYVFQGSSVLPKWVISSIRAEALKAGEEIHLAGSVIIKDADRQSLMGKRLQTEQLTVYPRHDYAESEVDVEIRQGDRQSLRGLGAKIEWGKTQKIQLLAQVTGDYVPITH